MRIVGGLLALLPALVGCSQEKTQEELLVSASASLTDAFSAIEEEFEEIEPEVDVVLNLGGSSSLREQILEGAPADVFASADVANMEQVMAAGETASSPSIFAHNTLQIAVPPGNPAGVTGLEAFADQDLLIGVCAEGVPCGDFAREVLSNAGVVPAIDTNELDVRSLLTKIEAGELDAGITYVTDVASADGGVEGIDIPDDVNVVAEYPIVVLAGATNTETAESFVEYVLSDEGQSVLVDFGFSAS